MTRDEENIPSSNIAEKTSKIQQEGEYTHHVKVILAGESLLARFAVELVMLQGLHMPIGSVLSCKDGGATFTIVDGRPVIQLVHMANNTVLIGEDIVASVAWPVVLRACSEVLLEVIVVAEADVARLACGHCGDGEQRRLGPGGEIEVVSGDWRKGERCSG